MLRIKGEIRGEYLHLECEKWGGSVGLKNLRWVGGVPQVEVTCSKCEEHDELKLHPPTWIDIVPPDR